MDDTIERLALTVDRLGREGLTLTPIANVGLLKVSRLSDLPPEIYRPVVSLIVQGEKQLAIGSQVLTYHAGHTFTAAIDLPVLAKVTDASVEKPYLAISLAIDAGVVADLASQLPDPAATLSERGYSVDVAGGNLLATYDRLLGLIEHPEDVSVMAPLLERELLYRLLQGPQGAALGRMVTGSRRIARVHDALDLIGRIYREPFSVEEVARAVGMSSSSFHRQFKAATGMAPLQYQKTLRLYEARRLLVTEAASAGSVAFAVGYQSVSQFTREYRRTFGAPPVRDTRFRKEH